MTTISSFPCIADQRARILILGSMPGERSLQAEQYYAHPRNAFWPIVEALLQLPADSSYQQRIEALRQHGIALWDVLANCRRQGSLDSAIEPNSIAYNNLTGLLQDCHRIERIFFNGGTAETLFRRGLRNGDIILPRPIRLQRLPSTSPANARLTPADKLAHWRQLLNYRAKPLPDTGQPTKE
ncbi:DNA-deoxyinosine glycosylase [Marinobacterium arenosum]|uniref:DNA-deoxyinosine glycosylase n=1 Tax=Marinobacterium arenosum TaxID=2862496 RepID=UPI001C9648C5|nr:DNA-deoxyinosine glycosylase [Marinobacterium arenosum]MBY4678952.1 DNA-deoxyinosine glycosylase [Marinobacterium arenosum]